MANLFEIDEIEKLKNFILEDYAEKKEIFENYLVDTFNQILIIPLDERKQHIKNEIEKPFGIKLLNIIKDSNISNDKIINNIFIAPLKVPIKLNSYNWIENLINK